METVAGVFIICCMSFLNPFSGVKDNELRGCSLSPNCNSSQSWKYNYIHHVDPLGYKEDRHLVFQELHQFFKNSENVYIAEVKEDEYIRVTHFTKVFRFPDRVELYFPPGEKHIQVRSHSWVGLWDVFANRRRIAKLRKVAQMGEDAPKEDSIL
ncbi:MAG: DUF1499 domain-containing protein [Leptospira sp.]|nr:DUF1499 domain-containing protein [Leptospira sp.]